MKRMAGLLVAIGVLFLGYDARAQCAGCPAGGGGGPGCPFLVMQVGFTQSIYCVPGGFSGGIAFAPDGDVLTDTCSFSGSRP